MERLCASGSVGSRATSRPPQAMVFVHNQAFIEKLLVSDTGMYLSEHPSQT